MNYGIANYCITDFMCYCSAGKDWKEQKYCMYSKRASIAYRCMFYCELIDGHCDCVEAQTDTVR
jgi:hypothetical protein